MNSESKANITCLVYSHDGSGERPSRGLGAVRALRRPAPAGNPQRRSRCSGLMDGSPGLRHRAALGWGGTGDGRVQRVLLAGWAPRLVAP